MDCLEVCKGKAISFRLRHGHPESADSGRRAFMISAAMTSTAIAAKATEGKHMLTPSTGEADRYTRPVPAGAISIKNFNDHCTACQLCVSVCPNQVLRPSTSLMTMMQPEMHYDKGYCRPECTKCSEVCPAGAILPVSIEEKSSIRIGHAVVNLDLCVVNTDNVKCGNCARHCPAGAIKLVRKNPEDKKSLRIPTVVEDRCIGCGACEHLCPSKPVSAIHVEGNEVHSII